MRLIPVWEMSLTEKELKKWDTKWKTKGGRRSADTGNANKATRV